MAPKTRVGKWLLTRRDSGAASGNRTPDLRITSALLCQLSYPGGSGHNSSAVRRRRKRNRAGRAGTVPAARLAAVEVAVAVEAHAARRHGRCGADRRLGGVCPQGGPAGGAERQCRHRRNDGDDPRPGPRVVRTAADGMGRTGRGERRRRRLGHRWPHLSRRSRRPNRPHVRRGTGSGRRLHPPGGVGRPGLGRETGDRPADRHHARGTHLRDGTPPGPAALGPLDPRRVPPPIASPPPAGRGPAITPSTAPRTPPRVIAHRPPRPSHPQPARRSRGGT